MLVRPPPLLPPHPPPIRLTSSLLTQHPSAPYSVPLGFGMLMSNITTGKLLDRDFRNTRLKIQRQRLLDAESSQPAGSSTNANTSAPRLNEREVLTPMSPDDILEFPIEYSRLRLEPICEYPCESRRAGWSLTDTIRPLADCVLFWGSTIGYGWLAQSHAPLAVTLIFLFLSMCPHHAPAGTVRSH